MGFVVVDTSYESVSSNPFQFAEVADKKLQAAILRQRMRKYRRKHFKQLSPRNQHLIEEYISSQLGHQTTDSYSSFRSDEVLVNEIRDGKISFAYEGLRKFPKSLVDILRNDITHLDLSSNEIKSFAFLSGFRHLKSLIVDENPLWCETLPPIDTLELFYANKCQIHSPRSFIFRLAVVFKNLKYLSMMENPAKRREVEEYAWKGKEHRLRMYTIFMIPALIHINDQKISRNERYHAKRFHQYLGPINCFTWKRQTNPDTDDIRSILSRPILKKVTDVLDYEENDEVEGLEKAFASVSIANYFSNYQIHSAEKRSSSSSGEQSSSSGNSSRSSRNTDVDEGLGSSRLGSSSPSENHIL